MQINCILDEGEPWFKTVDVAKVLKYTETDKALRRHVADVDQRQQGSFDLNPAFSVGWKVFGEWQNMSNLPYVLHAMRRIYLVAIWARDMDRRCDLTCELQQKTLASISASE